MNYAEHVLYNRHACLVAAQIVQEGFVDIGVGEVTKEANRFMELAHSIRQGPEAFCEQLLVSMMNPHANHSVKAWFQLLTFKAWGKNEAEMRTPDDKNIKLLIHTILDVIREHLPLVLTDCCGIRMVTGVIQFCARSSNRSLTLQNHTNVQAILDALVSQDTLVTYMKSPYANYAIIEAIDFRFVEIFNVVIENFLDIALDKYANYTLQKCFRAAKDKGELEIDGQPVKPFEVLCHCFHEHQFQIQASNNSVFTNLTIIVASNPKPRLGKARQRKKKGL